MEKAKIKSVLIIAIVLCVGFILSCGKSGGRANLTMSKNGASTDASAQSVSPVKKYDIKSGVITYSMDNSMLAGLGIKLSSKVYFDDYGKKESKETYNNSELSEKIINDGAFFYQVNAKKKTGQKSKSYSNGTEMRFAPEDYRDQDIKNYNVKFLANETICGKECKVYSTESKDTKAKYGGWNHITLFMEVEQGVGKQQIKVVNKATKIEENVSIPASVFEVPTNITVTEK